MLRSILAICIGASSGALLRWALGNRLNLLHPTIPFGTLAANLIGGYLVGIAVAYFASAPSVAPEWRLLIITGFLGGLTTFSTFSAEVMALLQNGRPFAAASLIALHLFGSLILTGCGFATVSLLRGT